MPRRYADYLGAPASPVLKGWATVGVVAAALVVLNVVVAVAYAVLRRRRAAASVEQHAQ
jgi:heme/copper-type cytochrome/quinol oxidase subunit 1